VQRALRRELIIQRGPTAPSIQNNSGRPQTCGYFQGNLSVR